MLIIFYYILILLLNNILLVLTNNKLPTVLIAMLVRNKAHTLPYCLSYLEDLDYPKDRISLWIRSDHNEDNSIEILQDWLDTVEGKYHMIDIVLDTSSKSYVEEIGPAHWIPERFAHVIELKEEAWHYARKTWADYIFYLDTDVVLTNKQTLKKLVQHDYTVTAPMLKSEGLYSNFWCGMTDDYYYQRTEEYKPIIKREKIGCFNVPMIHSAVLVNVNRIESDFLTFNSTKLQAYNGPNDDIITFAISANMSGVQLHVCNDEWYGYLMVPLEQSDKLHFDLTQLVNLKLDILASNPTVEVKQVFDKYIHLPTADRLGLDTIYMINLVRRFERRERMLSCFQQLGLDVKIIDAVDGRALEENVLERLGINFMPEYKDPYHKRSMTHGEIGCFLSHYNVWKEVVEQKQEIVMVLEDDVRFEPFFREKTKNLLNEARNLNLDWDLIYLGRKRLQDNEEWVEGSKMLVHVTYSYWTLGYLLTLRGAEKLLQNDPLKNLIPVDEYLPILFDKHPEEIWKEHFPKRDLIAYSISPLLIYPTHYTGESGYISDTENSRIIHEEMESVVKEEL